MKFCKVCNRKLVKRQWPSGAVYSCPSQTLTSEQHTVIGVKYQEVILQ